MAKSKPSRARTPSMFEAIEPDAELLDERLDGDETQRTRGPLVQVAFNRAVRREFTYAVPALLADRVRPGSRVAVPFGASRQVGVVVALATDTALPSRRLKTVSEVLDPEPVVDADLLALTRWIAQRYACAWGEALATVLPAPLKRGRGVRQILVAHAAPQVGVRELERLATSSEKQHRTLRTLLEFGGPVEVRELLRRLRLSESPLRSLEARGAVRIERADARPDPLAGGVANRPRPARLSDAQQRAVDAIVHRLETRVHAGFLLHGVTGSGKTEVYLSVIQRALEMGRSAIVLVPEIALTPQTVGWFRARFGEVAVLHSKLTDAQRLEAWMRVKRGELRVVVGARSAVFAPLADLGVIVIDEEHEPSFKQGATPRYHARDVALERARLAAAVCVLGSATPSLETWHAARAGRLERLLLPERVGGGSLPQVHVVDMRLESEKGKESPLFSRLLAAFLRETVAAREQAILFLNRRGFVPVLWCPGCSATVRCAHCDVGLTFHRRIRRLVCHACCEESLPPPACPTCSRPGLKPLGVGSERVEHELARLLPEARVARMDSDTMRRREDYEVTLERFASRETDVLVGTQMIAKGLDFPRVTLVGIVSADQALHLPDFRAAERTFQLIAQVAGRAGRSRLSGRIVVQTIAPEHPTIRRAARGEFEAFATEESELRAELGYPPHGRLVRVLIEDEDEGRVATTAEEVWRELTRELSGTSIEVLGPAPAPLAILRGRHRHHLLVKAPATDPAFERAVAWLADRAARESRPTLRIDVDPSSML
jgi:primosomal protein N' (replication factor Y)